MKDNYVTFTLTLEDVGRPAIHAFGRVWLVTDFLGRVLLTDVGKRVYLCRDNAGKDFLQAENDGQRAARQGGA